MITVTELCPICELESTHHTSIEDLKRTHGKTFCLRCGEMIMLCSMCKTEKCWEVPNCFELEEDKS